MSIAEDLVKLSVDDPVAEAAKNGKPPTIRDVKKSVKVCRYSFVADSPRLIALL